MFNLSIQAGCLYTKPYIPHLDENNVREEFGSLGLAVVIPR
jgi:hypothetical protein